MTSTYRNVIPNLIGNRNAMGFKINFAEHFVVPACAGMTTTTLIRHPELVSGSITQFKNNEQRKIFYHRSD